MLSVLANMGTPMTRFRGERVGDTGEVATCGCSRTSVRQIVNIANQGENGEFIYSHIAAIY